MKRLGSACRTTHVLVMAKAPIAGLAKTRLATTLGETVAADMAAACLLDTIDAVEGITHPHDRLIAITGDLTDAERGGEIHERLSNWKVIGQRGETFADRLVNAHTDAARLWRRHAVIVQIGMDTPQITGADLLVLAHAVTGHPASKARVAVGPAADGGWWGLASSAAGKLGALTDVSMSRHDTCTHTTRALRSTGAHVTLVHELTDVDTIDDARRVARANPDTRFAAGWTALQETFAEGVLGR